MRRTDSYRETLRRWLPHEVKLTLILFFTTRTALLIIGYLSRIAVRGGSTKYSSYAALDIWGVWDSGWYIKIAEAWYPVVEAFNPAKKGEFAFFPLYPGLMRLVSFITGSPLVSGIIISNVALIISSIFLYRLAVMDYDKETADRALKYFYLFPTAFILSGVFTESLYICFAILAFYAARRERWVMAGLFGLLLVFTRNMGILILIPLAWIYLSSRSWSFKKIDISFIALLLPVLGLGCVFLFYQYHTGDFLAFSHIQTAWQRLYDWPFIFIYNGVTGHDSLEFASFLAWFSLIGLAVFIIGVGWLKFSYWIYGLYQILLPLSSGLFSMPRMMLAVFPFAMIFGAWTKNKTFDMCLSLFFALIQGFLMAFWVNKMRLII